jgi:hypothetical protein
MFPPYSQLLFECFGAWEMLAGFLEWLVITLTFRAPFGRNTGSLLFSLATEVIHLIENMISIWLLLKGGTDVSTRIWGPLPRGDITVYLLILPRNCREYSLTCWQPRDTENIEPNHVNISNGLDLIIDSDLVAAIIDVDYWSLRMATFILQDIIPAICTGDHTVAWPVTFYNQMSYDLFLYEFVGLPPNQVYLTKSLGELLNKLWQCTLNF